MHSRYDNFINNCLRRLNVKEMVMLKHPMFWRSQMKKSKNKYRITKTTYGDGKSNYRLEKHGLFGWKNDVYHYCGAGVSAPTIFRTFKEAEKFLLERRVKPEKTVVKEYPSMCVVTLEIDDKDLKALKTMAKKNNMSLDELCNEALRLLAYPTKKK